jgi:hypothetical protein
LALSSQTSALQFDFINYNMVMAEAAVTSAVT